jgi:hypothetical protein
MNVFRNNIVFTLNSTKSILLLVAGFLCLAFSLQALASTLQPSPLPKQGSCPSGYSSSGNFCSPMPNANFALPKQGSCPSGYSSSGNYCLAMPNAKHALPKSGSCPSGYSSSGDYCLSMK